MELEAAESGELSPLAEERAVCLLDRVEVYRREQHEQRAAESPR